MLDEHIAWNDHIHAIELARARQFLNEESLKTTYFSYIHSYLNYTNIAWASTYSTKLKTIHYQQKDAVKIIFNEDILTHSRPLLRWLNALCIYQIDLYQHAISISTCYININMLYQYQHAISISTCYININMLYQYQHAISISTCYININMLYQYQHAISISTCYININMLYQYQHAISISTCYININMLYQYQHAISISTCYININMLYQYQHAISISTCSLYVQISKK